MNNFYRKSPNFFQGPNNEAEKQCCAYVLNVIFSIVFTGYMIEGAVFTILYFVDNRLANKDSLLFGIIFGLSSFFSASFFFSVLHWPSYCGGNPSVFKMLPFAIGMTIFWGGLAYVMIKERVMEWYQAAAIAIPAYILLNTLVYCGYIKNDAEKISCIKPWVYKPKTMKNVYGIYHRTA